MTIYGRCGTPVEIVRWAIIDDVKHFEGRKPDKRDRDALANDSYLIVRYTDTGREALYHQAFLRADGAAPEIATVRDALPRPFTKEMFAVARRGLTVQCRPPGSDTWYEARITSRSQTRLHVQITNSKSNHCYSLTCSDARKWLRVPAVQP